MNDCPFESDVLDALASRRWPAKADEALRAHVDSCESCADLADAAGALMSDHEAAHEEARVPPASVVWQRAQFRARIEAAYAAARPIGFAQGVGFSAAIAAAIAAAVWAGPLLAGWLPDASAFRLPSVTLPSLDVDVAALLSNTAVQLTVAAWALLTPVAVYLVTRD